MTDNRSVTRFFQTKAIPPTLWNACDYVLQFNFHIMHVAGTQKKTGTLPEETIETEEEVLLQKVPARQSARDEETTKIKLAITETTPIPINKASYTFGARKKMRVSGLSKTRT